MVDHTCVTPGCGKREQLRNGLCSRCYQRSRAGLRTALTATSAPQASDPENWLPIPGWESRYEVSDLGRVRSLPFTRSTGTVRPGRILKPGSVSVGHLFVNLWVHNKATPKLVHRLVLEAFVGPPPVDTEGCHVNGIASDNRLPNLMWGTHSQNEKHKIGHGTNRNAAKTHCPREHEYTPENTYVDPSGGRACRICASDKKLRYKRKQKELRRSAANTAHERST